MQWVKGIENLNVSRFRAQGIVGAAVSIHTCIASSPREDSRRIGRIGCVPATTTSCLRPC